MTSRTVAVRYARALFDVALAESDPGRIGDQLAGFGRLMAEHPDLGRVLTHPAVPPRIKRGIVERLTDALALETPLRKLLLLVADRDRLALVPWVEEAYRRRLLEHRRVVEAHVTTAAPLPPDRVEALARRLRETTGRDVQMTVSVDPSILGGVVARLGSIVYDGSVVRQLERLRARLVEDVAPQGT